MFEKTLARADIREAKEDINLLSMALRELWPISDEMRGELLQKQMDIVNNPLLGPDVKIAATANILRASATNLKAIDTIVKLGLAVQQTQATNTRITSDSELQQGLSSFLNDDAGVPPETISEKTGWNLEKVG